MSLGTVASGLAAACLCLFVAMPAHAAAQPAE